MDNGPAATKMVLDDVHDLLLVRCTVSANIKDSETELLRGASVEELFHEHGTIDWMRRRKLGGESCRNLDCRLEIGKQVEGR